MNERIYYIDILKFLAIFGVIFIHICGFTGHSEIMHYQIKYLSQIFHFAVPIFLMITGTLLLNRNITIKAFVKKRFARIIYPYIFWIILAIIMFLYVSNSYLQDYPMIIIDKFFTMSWNWYFWMMVGVYLAIPVINDFILNRGDEGCKYFVVLMIFTSIYYSITGISAYTTGLDLRFFILPIAYVVLGYFLSSYDFKIAKNRIVPISLMVFLLATGLKLMFPEFTVYFTNDVIFLNSGLNINFLGIIQASAIFLLIKNLNHFNNSYIKSFVISVSKSSYGMYLSHIILLIPLSQIFRLISTTGSQTLFLVIFFSVLIFLITWIAVLTVDRIPKLHRFSGYL